MFLQEVTIKSRPEILTLFEVTEAYFVDTTGHTDMYPTVLNFALVFSRRYGSYFLTTILPCILIGLLGTLTHCFSPENISERIDVTLQCLIVLASLFSQMSSTLPQSATAKAIEVMFFAQIAHLSLVFVNHTIVDIVRRRENSHVLLLPRKKVNSDQKLFKKTQRKFGSKEKLKMDTTDTRILLQFPAHLINSWTFSQKLEAILIGIEVLFFVLFYFPFFLYVYLEKEKVLQTFKEIRIN
ncbi:hypothetical protein Avbf_07785 [Armadillidium vulgare]|nr:hypothetical protein Avbf_07785 [Armadillidium vulgare]